jgi:hypothetical protein
MLQIFPARVGGLCLLICFFYISVTAQTIRLGLVEGIYVSQWTSPTPVTCDKVAYLSPLGRIQIGVIGTKQLKEWWSVRGQLGLRRAGAMQHLQFEPGYVEDYMAACWQVGLSFDSQFLMALPWIEPYLLSGVGVHYSWKWTETSCTDEQVRVRDYSFSEAGWRRVHPEFLVGGGLQKKIGRDARMFAEYRLHVGMMDITRSAELREFPISQTYQVGLVFPVGKRAVVSAPQ